MQSQGDDVTNPPVGRRDTSIGGLAGDDTGDDRDRPPIVLLHGLTFDRRTWQPVVDAFRALDRDRRVINLDLPGHGASPSHPPHDLPAVAELIHETLVDVGADRPVMVGHSISGAIVSLYASTYPAAGLVNVDQPPLVGPFAELVKSIEPQLRGPAFADMWSMFFRSFNTDLLPPAPRQLVEDTCRPRQDVVLGYWEMLLERPIAEITAMIEESCERLTGGRVPYVLVTGNQLPDDVRQWIQARLPHADIAVWDGSGHFPHLAHPDRFALLLDSTAGWSNGQP